MILFHCKHFSEILEILNTFHQIPDNSIKFQFLKKSMIRKIDRLDFQKQLRSLKFFNFGKTTTRKVTRAKSVLLISLFLSIIFKAVLGTSENVPRTFRAHKNHTSELHSSCMSRNSEAVERKGREERGKILKIKSFPGFKEIKRTLTK